MSKKSITTLLLVEDNLVDARLLREMFNQQGSHIELTHVECMSEAEKYLAEHAVDVILIDPGLPDAQGLEAVRRAHAAAPRVPLVVLTGLDDESLAAQALQEGAQDYLIKGQIEMPGLLRALRYAIERTKMEEALLTERKRSEEGWARLAAIHEATTDLVSISDPEGRLLYVNRGGRRMLGLGEEADITGHTIADFLPNAATHVMATEGIPTAVRDGIWRGEVEMARVDGSTISISQILLAHKRADGSVEFLSTIGRDITERKHTEQRLATQLALTKLLNQEAPLAETARGIMRTVCENLGWEIGALWEVDPESQRMQCVDAWHDSTVSTDIASDLTQAITFPRGEGLPGAVWESGSAMWVTDLGDVKRFLRAAPAARAGIRAALAFPILHQGNVLGAMEFFSRQPRELDQALLPAMMLIGSQIGEYIERGRTAQALRESEERYRVVSETAPDAIFTIDADTRILFCNPAVERLFGYAPSEMLGQKLEIIIPERLREAHRGGIESYLRLHVRDIPWNGVELIGQHRDGHEFPVEISFGHWTSGTGTIYTGYARDITERRRTDEALRASEARLRRLLDSNIIGVTFWNTKGDLFNANELFLKMIGYSQEDLQHGNLSWIDLTPPEYAPADAKALAEMAATGTCTPFEKEFIRKDGSRVTVLVGSALLDDQSDTGSSFVMDITERKQAEARLRLQSAALNAAANATVIAERDGTIVWINPAFTELTGYTDQEATGRNVRDLLDSGAHDEAFYKDIQDTILAGKSWSGEFTNRRKDGRLYPEASTITPVKDDDGTISHFISIKTDLSAQRQMEAQLRQAQKMEAVGQLAAGVAHEFNNLLQALMSRAAIVRLRGGTAEVEKIGAEMELQIRRGASITQQLLLFSRSHATEKSNLDLRQKVKKASVLLRQFIPENIRIVVETPPERLSVEGDAGQMQQVLLNLAINARDAMPAGGTLTLRAGSCGGEVFLEVEDTGHGLDEATRARIFEPFFTTKEVGKGSGLGLAVVHGIVERHFGRIEVQSRPGEGSRFRVILPTAFSESVPTPKPTDDAGMPVGSGRVLLVEDEEGVRAGIAVLLEMIGYEVTAVGSGEEAIAIPLEPAPDLLLSDITLPGIAGLALGERLLQRWPSLNVVLMSGYIEEALRANASERGWHFLQKPFEMTDLVSHLRAALDGKMPGTMSSRARSRSATLDDRSLLATLERSEKAANEPHSRPGESCPYPEISEIQ